MSSNEYVCYSTNLFMYLRGMKFKPKKTGVNRRTGRTYVVFDLTQDLSKALALWSIKN